MDYIWLIFIMVAVAVLPDLLRRRRNYPKRKGPIPIPPRKEEVKRNKQPLQQPVKATTVPAATKKKQTPAAVKEKTAAQPTAVHSIPTAPASVSAVNPGAAAAITVPHMVRPEPWSMIEPEARDIYAGLVWAELLDKPLALRNKK